ncbi:hypothetical protein [Streptomyces stelliscabiei]|uniref:Uncharacterized protein n=1 Tax=Streptomyces stelliscabiei TaxID=146820 RepID=A0A8I0TYR6_9ACTN|nr:hypothetical protein [Streptomyces stelliscabiei]KND43105.1 hypothetical protein IQ64_19925 [Streptomyces stelliscabiei]MBE1602693.1 hypothetical protein [Streptomyces stelliscabiei]MDX2516897.1 hypothetical protein [Streptomyces stelliscabiei]MDX2550640.1 hypothetical protein [Streptomyces stelliscabiei]MDX2610338.1 hypothetical protein [Streptomyces stelliscabiei]
MLVTALITTLPPDTALYTVTLIGIVVALVGAASLLGLENFRERTPRAVRSGWLGIVALGQVTITCWSLRNVFEQDPGPDIVFGVAVATAALGVAVACVVEACASGPSTPTVQG